MQALNPLVGILVAFRWALLGTPVALGSLLIAMAVSAVVFAVGLAYFSGVDRTIADDV